MTDTNIQFREPFKFDDDDILRVAFPEGLDYFSFESISFDFEKACEERFNGLCGVLSFYLKPNSLHDKHYCEDVTVRLEFFERKEFILFEDIDVFISNEKLSFQFALNHTIILEVIKRGG